MTKLLEQAWAEIQKLPADEQDQIAQWMLYQTSKSISGKIGGFGRDDACIVRPTDTAGGVPTQSAMDT